MKKLVTFISSMVALALSSPCGYAADKVYTFKLSVETVESHHRNKALKIFRCLLEKNSKGRLKVDYYHSGQVYKGKDIPKALKIGTIEMAVPGIWQLEGVDPNTSITALPMFYGLHEDIALELMDGEVGKLVGGLVEKKLDVKILGKWYRHGYANSASKTKPIKTLEDWKGLKIRYMGGAANALRLKALGANPIMIPWPDLPVAMLQGAADGFIATATSFVSAKLWDSGVRYWTKDRQYVLQFVPMMNGKFWRSLPKDLQKTILDTWEEHVDMQWAINDFQRANSEKAMRKHGMEIYSPSDEELAKWRDKIMPVQDQIIEELGMDKDLVTKVKGYLEDALKK
jgi:TRAP-type C4-dicarboxylate transport system substrate-binding protein